jgi:ABC-type uncharacterized transport system permease subunit
MVRQAHSLSNNMERAPVETRADDAIFACLFSVAESLNMPFVMLFVVFGGFLIPRSEVPDWLIWAYYLSPFSCQSHQRTGC